MWETVTPESMLLFVMNDDADMVERSGLMRTRTLEWLSGHEVKYGSVVSIHGSRKVERFRIAAGRTNKKQVSQRLRQKLIQIFVGLVDVAGPA